MAVDVLAITPNPWHVHVTPLLAGDEFSEARAHLESLRDRHLLQPSLIEAFGRVLSSSLASARKSVTCSVCGADPTGARPCGSCGQMVRPADDCEVVLPAVLCSDCDPPTDDEEDPGYPIRECERCGEKEPCRIDTVGEAVCAGCWEEDDEEAPDEGDRGDDENEDHWA